MYASPPGEAQLRAKRAYRLFRVYSSSSGLNFKMVDDPDRISSVASD
jgi:hypothetical protein